MKFSEQWLREWVNPSISTDELVAQVTMAGLEVDNVEAAAGDFTGVVVAEITAAEQHPNADKLRVCQVFDGEQTHQIVCGAPNARVGIKVAFARVGAVLPGNFKIKKAKLRQVESHGMLCSSLELNIGEDHDGIMELSANAPLGEDLVGYMQLDDQIIDVDLTPNRGDCLSIAGLAREVGVLNSATVHAITAPEIAAQIEDTFPVKLTAPGDCPRFTHRVVRNVDVSAPSPEWMVERLRRSGIRSIDAVVDITAYVMLELGQPMHAYDLDKLNGALHVRRASQGEQLTLLNDQTIELDEDVLVIADGEGVIGMAGIMGGSSTGVSTQTTNVLLEAAFFNPVTIAGKARRFGLHTDASHRFERGVDYLLQHRAMDRATQLLIEICGGVSGPFVEQCSTQDLPQDKRVTLRKDRLTSILAQVFDDAQVEDILIRLGLVLVEKDANGWTFSVPSWRYDIAIEADLIEEVARIYGYNNLPSTLPMAVMEIPKRPEKLRSVSQLRRHLVSREFHEAITYSMVEPGLMSRIDDQHVPVVLANPISADMSAMRTNMWPGLINALRYNINRQQDRVRLFEIGQCFIPSDIGLQQIDFVAGIIVGARQEASWHGKNEPVDFFDLKGDVQSLLKQTSLCHDFVFEVGAHAALHPRQTANIVRIDAAGERVNVGMMGSIHPQLAKDLDVPMNVQLFSLQLEPLLEGYVPTYQALSKYPEMRRDLAILVPESVSLADVEQVVEKTAGQCLTAVNLFDIYQGQGIEDGYKSLAITMAWQHQDRTLLDEEVNGWFAQSLDALTSELGAKQR